MRIPSIALALMALPALAQAPSERPPLVVPVGVDLVQVDAVVTDKDGRYVTDLTAADFEIVEDGSTRAIANFRYVQNAAPVSDAATVPVAAPASPATPAETRTLAIVIDDLSLSFEGSVWAKRALGRLVDERLAPGELAAIVRTGGGMGNLQQFTSDKRLLKAAILGVPFNLHGRGPVAAVEADPNAPGQNELAPASDPAGATMAAMQARLRGLEEKADRQRQVSLALGSLTSVEAVVQALARMPGRKALMLVSEGFVLAEGRNDVGRVSARLHEVIEGANRASIVVYALDPAGLKTYGASASQFFTTTASARVAAQSASASAREVKTGIVRLAEETGGLALVDTNDLDGSVERVFQDQRGYYLLGFEPAEGTAASQGRHKVEVKAKRSGLRVRARRTFYARQPLPPPAEDPNLMTTLVSPFTATDVPVRLTALFHHDPPKGSFVRALLYIDAQALTLRAQPDGTSTTEVEAAALAFGATGRLMGEAGGTYSLRLAPAAAAAARAQGLVLTLDIAAPPGPYQIRSAVRDVATRRAGSAYQFVEVPDLAKGRMAVSGIVLSGTDAAGAASDASLDPRSTPAVRSFDAGDRIAYAFAVYNAARRPTGEGGLDVRVGLVRDGVPVATIPGPAVSVPGGGPVPIAGALRLSPRMAPGTYTLLVLVTDPARKPKEREAVQQIDFEVTSPTGS